MKLQFLIFVILIFFSFIFNVTYSNSYFPKSIETCIYSTEDTEEFNIERVKIDGIWYIVISQGGDIIIKYVDPNQND